MDNMEIITVEIMLNYIFQFKIFKMFSNVLPHFILEKNPPQIIKQCALWGMVRKEQSLWLLMCMNKMVLSPHMLDATKLAYDQPLYIHICVYKCVCVCMYIHIRIHTHKHTHTHTYFFLLCSHSYSWNTLMLFAIFHVSALTKAISRLWKWQKVNN